VRKTKEKVGEPDKPTVIVEACKSWGVFKRSTSKLWDALGSKVDLVVNAEKPRKGTFEVRVGDDVIISHVGMPRPFKKLRETSMEDVAKKVLESLWPVNYPSWESPKQRTW